MMSPSSYAHWLLLLSQLTQVHSFRVLESLPAKNNAQNKNNQQQFSKMMPPLPINTWWTQPLLESSGKAVRNLNHPLWYDDHNPTARKVTYLDSTSNDEEDGFRSESSFHFLAFADDWDEMEPYSPTTSGRGRRRPLANAWRRITKWRRQSSPKPSAEI